MFFILKPVDYIAFFLTLLYYPYFRLFVIPKGLAKKKPIIQDIKLIIEKAKEEPLNSRGFATNDSHTLIAELGTGLIHPELKHDIIAKMVTESGSLYRRYPDNQGDPSSECLLSWIMAYKLWNIDRKDLVKKIALSYLKHCFTLRWDAKGGAASRSSNSGISLAYGAWPRKSKSKWWPFEFGITQPMTSSFFYSTLAPLSFFKKELGGIWTIIYYLYYIIHLGPIHKIMPVMYTKKDRIYYMHHVVMMALWVLNKTSGGYKYQLNNVTVTISPDNTRQPWICGMAADCGALKEEDRILALNTLFSINGAHDWPQYPATNEGFFKGSATKGWKNMYLALTLLCSKSCNK